MRFRMRACGSVKAVPCGATTLRMPCCQQRIRSICPSHKIALPDSMIGRFVLFSPNRIRLFTKIGVSGEFTYFCAFASGSSSRPLKATTSPASL